MRIGVIGINHKLASLQLREKLGKACQKWFGIGQIQHEQHSFILLSTCNRTEVYFSSEDLPKTHSYLLKFLRHEIEEEFDHKLYSFFGIDCFCHLTRVTLGLDSAIVGETEIQGQVKLAYEQTAALHSLPKEMHFVFQKSLNIAKQVRTQFPLSREIQSLEEVIYDVGKKMFVTPQCSQLLLVGASQINQKILLFLKKKKLQNITICNRSEREGEKWKQCYDIHHLPWSKIRCWHTYDWVITGTKSSEYLLMRKDLPFHLTNKKLLIDLSVPRNIDPQIAQDSSVALFNMDQMNGFLKIHSHHIFSTIAEAEKRVINITQQHAKSYEEKAKYPMEKLAIIA